MSEKIQQQPPQAPQMAYAPGGAPPSNGNGVAQKANGDGSHGGPVASRDWNSGFCSCFSPLDLCCFAYWCPCVLFGKTHARLSDPSLASYSPFNSYCLGFCALAYCGGLQSILQCIDRGNIREQYGIEGSGVTDCLGAWCCPHCGLVQQEKEVKLRTQGGAAPAQGYQQNPQMNYN